MLKVIPSQRMQYYRAGIFAELAGLRRELEAGGHPTIDLSIGSPDTPPALPVCQALARAAAEPDSYGYSLGDLPELRQAAAGWYDRRYGVRLDPQEEILFLSGAQDGLVHFFLAFLNPGDTVLVPDPCFPAVLAGVRLAGATPVFLPLRQENDFLIDLSAIPEPVARAAKLLVFSYPNNPTTAVAPDSFYRELIEFAARHNILLLSDNAYSEIVFDGRRGRSLLEFPGGMEQGVEFNSLSKAYSIPGARMAFCMGRADAVQTFARLKSNLDLGSFLPVQRAAIAALTGDQSGIARLRRLYQSRRDALRGALEQIGLQPVPCQGTLVMWLPLPARWADDRRFVLELLHRSGVVLAPGSAFGTQGAGYVRLSLMHPEQTLCEAVQRMADSRLL